VRILTATVPLTGHVQPMRPIVRALVDRGHRVTWYGAKKFERAITDAGATYAPMCSAPDWDDDRVEEALPALRGQRGLARVRTQLFEMFIAPMRAQLADLRALGPHDAILADQAHLGAALYAEITQTPWVGLGISALVIPSKDLAPFGTARRPGDPPIVNRFLYWLVNRVLFRSINRSYRAERLAAGVSDRGTYFDVLSPDLFLQPTVRSFEYPRSDLPSQVRFIGPIVPRVKDAVLPIWWNDVVAARASGTPVVLVTQGTLATAPRELVGPALTALEHMDVLVVATTPATPSDVGRRAWPANARVAPFVPYDALLPLAQVMVTNGGYGGVQMALARGVPLVVAGGSEEKPEIARRVAWCGAGIDVRTGRPSPSKIRGAVRRVLDEPSFRERARVLAAEIATTDAPTTAVAAIEDLLAARQEVAA
jgi:MGT family glycosyltransferase